MAEKVVSPDSYFLLGGVDSVSSAFVNIIAVPYLFFHTNLFRTFAQRTAVSNRPIELTKTRCEEGTT